MLKRAARSKTKDQLPKTVGEAEVLGDVLPQTYHVAALRERRLLISLRAVSIGLIASLLFNTTLAIIIFTMLPLKEVRPFLVRVMDEGSVVADIQPIPDTFDAEGLLTEKLVREYVATRHEILRANDVMTRRWGGNGQMAMMSTQEEYRRFVQTVASQLENIRRLNGQSLVEVISVVPITEGRSYVVDFRLTTFDNNDRTTEDRVYTATMEVEYRPQSGLTRDQLLINPTGFTVVAYSVAEKTQ